MGSFTRVELDMGDPRQPTRGRAVGPGTIAQGQEQNKATRGTVRADPIRVPCRNYGAPIFLFIEHEEARESNTLGRACPPELFMNIGVLVFLSIFYPLRRCS